MNGRTIVVGGVSHETNTFAAGRTTRDEFQLARECVGSEMVEAFDGTDTELGRGLAVAARRGVEVEPTVYAGATPGGVVTDDAYECYRDRIVAGAEERDVDGVFLGLHGAMVTETRFDAEGDLLAAVRDAVGEEVPVAATLDHHANVSERMVEIADILVAYKTYPHVDMGETGRRCMERLLDAVDGRIDPVMGFAALPLVAAGPATNTEMEPMASIFDETRRLEQNEGIVAANVCPGFLAADIPQMGFSVTVVGDGGPVADEARELAEVVWDRRDDFALDCPSPGAAAERIASDEYGGEPVVVADAGDNPGSGAPCDGTVVLRALLDRDVEDVAVAIIRDPEVVEECIDAGVGERVEIDLGAKAEDSAGRPLEGVDGYVKAITDGRYVNRGAMATGDEKRLGRTVRLLCGPDDSYDVIVTENRVQPYDAEAFRHIGITPEEQRVVVLTSSHG